MWALVSVVLLQLTRVTDRRTDRQTDSIFMAIRCVALHAVARQEPQTTKIFATVTETQMTKPFVTSSV